MSGQEGQDGSDDCAGVVPMSGHTGTNNPLIGWCVPSVVLVKIKERLFRGLGSWHGLDCISPSGAPHICTAPGTPIAMRMCVCMSVCLFVCLSISLSVCTLAPWLDHHSIGAVTLSLSFSVCLVKINQLVDIPIVDALASSARRAKTSFMAVCLV